MLLLRIIYVISVLFLLCFRARLIIDALWSPAEKGLASWLSFVMCNCEVLIFYWYPGSDVGLDLSIPDLCPLSYFKAVIEFFTKVRTNANEIHWHMAGVYGVLIVPMYSTVAKWSAEFKRERDSSEDDPRPGRPADVISQMIDCVERLVLNDDRIKVDELAS